MRDAFAPIVMQAVHKQSASYVLLVVSVERIHGLSVIGAFQTVLSCATNQSQFDKWTIESIFLHVRLLALCRHVRM